MTARHSCVFHFAALRVRELERLERWKLSAEGYRYAPYRFCSWVWVDAAYMGFATTIKTTRSAALLLNAELMMETEGRP
jgi:hypothetical protein